MNIFLTSDGFCKLGDFGAAHGFDDATHDAKLILTFSYCSYEVKEAALNGN